LFNFSEVSWQNGQRDPENDHEKIKMEKPFAI
jgi:hypothetical protein